ncbi:uncharacterized protein CIMG_00425 [Coccidioides immitis RS]|uniref:CENP-T/Histone H4 histone fold domain-containing protein n=1 Tax=Coccidioides immitis (strain RS) TaxID=246410 RepID=J3KGZ6_COCIM|nr:uncharacterized protein CIMG_00425 [Coccidioides immitis RS]EAS35071.3 hypothetical protein CIMG_00425 [Coccidioides immitis RS]
MSSPSGPDALRITPRRRRGSAGAGPSPAHNTPSSILQQLAGMAGDPATPAGRSRRSLSASRVSLRRSSRGVSGIGISDAFAGGSHAPATPHALKAFQRRAAVYTPGRDRRKSGRVQRETPLDILRNLGKALAPTSEVIKSSPMTETDQETDQQESEDLDEEPDLPRPRLSLPMHEMIVPGDGDGSPEIVPPRLSLPLDEDDFTQRSIEMPRRERSTRDLATLSRYSLASTRFSEHFGDASRLEYTEEGMEFTAPQGDDNFVDDQIELTAEQPIFDLGGETEDLRRFDLNFSFPTPDAPQHIENEHEDFVLDTTMPIADDVPVSSDDDFGAGDLELAVREGSPRPPLQESSPQPPQESRLDQNKERVSKHGIPVPKLPRGIVKRLATRFARTGNGSRTRISKEALAALEKATDWFFEQANDDLSAYSKHSTRKTVDETDVIALMKRQRQIGKGTSVFALAQKYLPKELLQDIRLAKK